MIQVVSEGIRVILSSTSLIADDRTDKFIRKSTIIIILCAAFIIASKRYFGSPISCVTTEMPLSISQHWIDTVCWINDKQTSPFQIVGINHSKVSASHYQFTVEALIFVSMILSAPGYLWNGMLGGSGYKLKRISTITAAIKQSIGSQKITYLKEFAGHLNITRRYHRFHWSFNQELNQRLSKSMFLKCPLRLHLSYYFRNRYFIPVAYVFVKVIYIIAIVVSFVVLEYCLGFKYISYGFTIIDKVKSGMSPFLDEQFFPKRTYCLISRSKLGGTDATWADCVLPINVINNIVFLLLWFWLIIVLLISIYSFFRTLLKILPSAARLFLSQHLRAYNLYVVEEHTIILRFIEKCPPDVVLILRLYEVELGKTLIGDIISQLFIDYKINNTI